MVLHDMANAVRLDRGQMLPNPAQLQQAMLAPDELYAAPSDVMLDYHLPMAQKIALLRNWKDDLEQRSMARGEGMVTCEEGLSHAISTVTSAIERLQMRMR